MKYILAVILSISSFVACATSFPNSLEEARAMQLSPDYQSLSSGFRADVDGAYGIPDRSTHLDSVHQPITTPHLDAPIIDRSSHLDAPKSIPAFTMTASEPVVKQVALTASTPAIKQTELVPATKVINQTLLTPATQVVKQTALTPATKVITNTVTHEVKTHEVVVKSETRLVENKYDDSAIKNGIESNSRRIASTSSSVAQTASNVSRNTSDIRKLKSDVSRNTRDIKRVGANAIAAANLHYNSSESGYAISVGEYEGETAIAAGLQFNTSERSAITLQVSADSSGTGASAGFHSSF